MLGCLANLVIAISTGFSRSLLSERIKLLMFKSNDPKAFLKKLFKDLIV